MKELRLREFQYLTQATKLLNSKLKPRQSASQACSLTTPLLHQPIGSSRSETAFSDGIALTPKMVPVKKSVGCRNEQ